MGQLRHIARLPRAGKASDPPARGRRKAEGADIAIRICAPEEEGASRWVLEVADGGRKSYFYLVEQYELAKQDSHSLMGYLNAILLCLVSSSKP